jgi:ABC-type branched-subunit amino acid transport system ATPase component
MVMRDPILVLLGEPAAGVNRTLLVTLDAVRELRDRGRPCSSSSTT